MLETSDNLIKSKVTPAEKKPGWSILFPGYKDNRKNSVVTKPKLEFKTSTVLKWILFLR